MAAGRREGGWGWVIVGCCFMVTICTRAVQEGQSHQLLSELTVRSGTGGGSEVISSTVRADGAFRYRRRVQEGQSHQLHSELTVCSGTGGGSEVISSTVRADGLVSDAELALKLRESDDIIKSPETTIAPPPAQRRRCFTSCFLGCSLPFVYLVPYALSAGVRHRQAAFLMSILGVLDIVGNVTFGWLTDRRCLKAYRLPCYVLAVAMEGLCCLFVPLLRSFQLLVPFAVLYGYFDGAYVALIPVVISDVVGAPYLSSALGVVYFLHAIPYLLSPPVGGWLVDVTGSYSPTFFLSGGALLASAAMISAITGIRRCRRHLNASADKPRPLCLPDQSERPVNPAGAT
ncbi:hypothetical protein JOQ06_007906 [Pogonophryne albipinna]|uniref:Uncharacterized protein n=1 Tax=Pogonophryne albipinna TaxID=1090488 RepID=A0AAD6A664_9TELE|nr:hypothetical protein JOQ06_007906 [Pogonophryne albipinna]